MTVNKHQLAKIGVGGDHNSPFGIGKREDLRLAYARSVVPGHRGGIVAQPPEVDAQACVGALVNEDP